VDAGSALAMVLHSMKPKVLMPVRIPSLILFIF
jgi:hypothetical protein